MTSISAQCAVDYKVTQQITLTNEAGFLAIPVPTDRNKDKYVQVIGFSLVPSASGTLSFISGNSGNTDNDIVLWATSVTSGVRLDFIGDFVFCERNRGLKISANGSLGNLTLITKYV